MKREALSLKSKIISSPTEINSLNKIIQWLIEHIDEKEVDEVLEYLPILREIYTHYLKNEKINSSVELVAFLIKKIEIVFKIIFEVASTEINDKEATIIFNVFDCLIPFVSAERESFYAELVKKIILSNEYRDHEILFLFITIFSKDYDVIFPILEEESKSINSSNQIFNLYNFLIANKKIDTPHLRELYQKIFVTLINNKNFSEELVREFLISLNKGVIDNVENPLIFSDYLVRKSAASDVKTMKDFDIKIFALNGLFVLLTKYKFDYDRYYNTLYELICKRVGGQTIFDSRYKNKFYKVLKDSLVSSSVPFVVVCSFLKKLCIISLFSKEEVVIQNLTLMLIIIQSHPRAFRMLTYKKSKKDFKESLKENSSTFDWDKFDSKISAQEPPKEKQIEIDETEYKECFDDNEIDPYKTKAKSCSLWELYTLEKHYNTKIRKLVKIFTSNFLPKQYALENTKEKDLTFDIKNTNAHFYISA